MIPPENAPPNDDPFGFAGLQKHFDAFLAELEEVGSLIACRLAEEKRRLVE
jgi:hypothetical protein